MCPFVPRLEFEFASHGSGKVLNIFRTGGLIGLETSLQLLFEHEPDRFLQTILPGFGALLRGQSYIE